MAASDLFANLLAYKDLENEGDAPDYSSVFSTDANLGTFENLLNQGGNWNVATPAEALGADYSNVFSQSASPLNLGSSQFSGSGSFNMPETNFGEIAQGGSKPKNLVRATNPDAAGIEVRQQQRQEVVRQSPGSVNRQQTVQSNWKDKARSLTKSIAPAEINTDLATSGVAIGVLSSLYGGAGLLANSAVNRYGNKVMYNYLDEVNKWSSTQGTPPWKELPPGVKPTPFSFEHAFTKKPEVTPSPKFSELLKNAKEIDSRIGLNVHDPRGGSPRYILEDRMALSSWTRPPWIAAHELGHAVHHSLDPKMYEYRKNAKAYQNQSPGIGTALGYEPDKNLMQSGLEGALINFGASSQILRQEFAADRYGARLSKGMQNPDLDSSGNPIPGSAVNFKNIGNVGAKGSYILGTAGRGFGQGVVGHMLGATADFAKNAISQGVMEPGLRKAKGGQDSRVETILRQYGYNPNDYRLTKDSSGQVRVNKRTPNPVGGFLMHKVWGVK